MLYWVGPRGLMAVHGLIVEDTMAGYRPKRFAELIFRELSVRLRNELQDPSLQPVSITHVDVTRDLRTARISWMPLGGGEPTPELIEAIDMAARKLRGPIGRAIRARHAPELQFKLDDHTEQAIRVTHLLSKLADEREARAGVDSEGEE